MDLVESVYPTPKSWVFSCVFVCADVVSLLVERLEHKESMAKGAQRLDQRRVHANQCDNLSEEQLIDRLRENAECLRDGAYRRADEINNELTERGYFLGSDRVWFDWRDRRGRRGNTTGACKACLGFVGCMTGVRRPGLHAKSLERHGLDSLSHMWH